MDVLLQAVIGGLAGGIGSTGTAATKPTPAKQGWLNTVAGVLGGVGGNFALGDTFTNILSSSTTTSTVEDGAGSGLGGLVGGIVLALIVGWLQKKFSK